MANQAGTAIAGDAHPSRRDQLRNQFVPVAGGAAGIVFVPAALLLAVRASMRIRELMALNSWPLPPPLWYGCWLVAVLTSALLAVGLRRLSRTFATVFIATAVVMALLLMAFVYLAAISFGPPD